MPRDENRAHPARSDSARRTGAFGLAFRALVYTGLLLLTWLLVTLPLRASPQAATRFVETSARNGIQILSNRTVPEADRRAQFGKAILAAFDSEGIGRFVVAPAWTTATPEQRARFQEAFKRALVNIYVERFFDYDGESLRTLGTEPAANDAVIVKSTVSNPSGTSNHSLDWLIVQRAGAEKLFDVVIDGISTTTTTAQDYQSVLRSVGGDLDRLSALLEAKNK